MKKLLLAAISLLLAGCSINSTFVYKPNAPVGGVQKLPVKVAVLPFKDGTEDFIEHGNVYNFAKGGIRQTITALTPELWAKAFADDLAASGSFQAVRFIYSLSELVDEDIYIEGTLKRATYAWIYGHPNEYSLSLSAMRRGDNRPFWEEDVAKVWRTTNTDAEGKCGFFSVQCVVDGIHADSNQVMQELFTAARIDLLHTLALPSASQTRVDDRLPATSPSTAPPESVDAEVDKILHRQ